MFWEAFPIYINYGMTSNQYWNDDPYLVVAYREASKMKLEADNYSQWWQGWYIYEATKCAMTATLPWFKKPEKYPEKPHTLAIENKLTKEEEQKRAREHAIASLNAWKQAWDSTHGEH